MESAGLLQLWGKTQSVPSAPAFHPLAFHLLDVAACAEAVLGSQRIRLERLADACAVNTNSLGKSLTALVALHDIGKCARGFQAKAPEFWPLVLGERPREIFPVRHDVAGLWLFENEPRLSDLIKKLIPCRMANIRRIILQSICGHHGEPVEVGLSGVADIANWKAQVGVGAKTAAADLADAICAVLDPPPIALSEECGPVLSYALAGFCVLSDWLGSNRLWFDFVAPATDGASLRDEVARYWSEVARPRAMKAVAESGLSFAPPARFEGLRKLFPDIEQPTPLQAFAESLALPDGPVLIVVEDMTGAGKTEAAVTLAHRLHAAGRARGVYVALPTMATANAMFGRLVRSYRALFAPEAHPSVVLVHGRRDLCEGFRTLPGTLARNDDPSSPSNDPSEIAASAFCADWIARSNKQAFLAQMGAGTIDQAILSVLPARHQSLRLWGLADKVLVVDEAHAYDAYMGAEIERLLEFHAALGGSAIVLSATLPREKRRALVGAYRKGLRASPPLTLASDAYPLVTIASAGGVEEHASELRESLCREVRVSRICSAADAHAAVLAAARADSAVALIRNTVDEAIESHELLSREFDGPTLLFHARFALVDRLAIEEQVLAKFGRKRAQERGTILVATQVVEQSLDLDFDLIVTDLAPIDLLIQRAGRLWRHMDERPTEMRPLVGKKGGPTLLVLSADPTADAGARWLDPVLPKTNSVYRDSALLWRSAKVAFAAGRIVSRTSRALAPPECGEVRALVEAVYGETKIPIPPGLDREENEAAGRSSAERSLGGFNVLKLASGYDYDGGRWDAEKRVPTRLSDPTITLRLAVIEDGRVTPWAARGGADTVDRRAWALSEVTVRKARCAGVPDQDDATAKLIEKAKVGWTISEKEMPILLLRPEGAESDTWGGVLLEGKERNQKVLYSEHVGFASTPVSAADAAAFDVCAICVR